MENLAGDGLHVGVGHCHDLGPPVQRRGDVAEVEHAFARPAGVGTGRLEGKLALGDGQALGAVQLAGAGAVRDEVVDFSADAGERLVARFRVEPGADFEGSGLVEEGDVAADLIAKPALLAEFEKQARARGFSQHRAEHSQCVAGF